MRFAVHGTLSWDPAEIPPNEVAAAEIVARALRIGREHIQVTAIGFHDDSGEARLERVPQISFVAEFSE